MNFFVKTIQKGHIRNINLILLATANFIFIALLYYTLFKFNIFEILPTPDNLVRWDANFYKEIKDLGYVFRDNKPSNLAFFPLFAYLWRVVESTTAICILNAIAFIVSIILLSRLNNIPLKYVLIPLTFPCSIFFILPYSESLFFFFGTMLIVGYVKNIRLVVILGVLGCCLVKAVSIVFIPILAVMLFCSYSDKRPGLLTFGAVLIATSTLAVLVVAILQWYDTGKWFYFLDAAKSFNRHWQLPSIPFTTISPEKIIGTDSISWCIGLISLYFVIKSVRYYTLLNFSRINRDFFFIPSVCFSLLFVCAIFLVDSLFTHNLEDRTNIWSINRHLMCTPFAFYLIYWFVSKYRMTLTDFCIIPVLILVSGSLTGVYQYPIHSTFYFAFLLSIFFAKVYPVNILLLLPVFFSNLLFSVFYVHQYLGFRWIG